METREKIISLIGVAAVGLLIWAAFFYMQNLRGIKPVLNDPPEKISESINTTDMPLQLPDGFSISIFADDLPGARVMAQDSLGNMWVSQTSEGTVSMLEVEDGRVQNKNAVFRNLDRPHGLAIDPQDGLLLYIAEEGRISRVRLYSEDSLEKIADLPQQGGGHFTRTIAFGPDGRLYVSIGSSCNVCVEGDERRAAIYSMNRDGSDFKKYAEGLRNTVFFTWHLVTGEMWGTDMGRDLLGDNTPPDEINILQEGRHYGWPYCHGKQVRDNSFGSQANFNCNDTVGSHIDIQAHSAPLGLGFVPEEGWPEEYWYDLLVAYHGSWNRTVPTGYKIERFKLDENGNLEGREDFIAGWLTENNESLGRPVDVMVLPGGLMYVSDDKAGVIYKVVHDN